jgi:hypothetical protein
LWICTLLNCNIRNCCAINCYALRGERPSCITFKDQTTFRLHLIRHTTSLSAYQLLVFLVSFQPCLGCPLFSPDHKQTVLIPTEIS